MMFSLGRGLLGGALLLLFAAGCIPTRDSSQDEQRDPHFLQGMELLKEADPKGAAAAFEKALATNPQSASAHFQLGLVFQESLNEPATAIYHYERFLKLRPTSDRVDIVRQRSNNCKMELAKLFLIAPSSPSVQKELDKLKTEVERLGLENHQLRRQVELLTSQQPARSAPAPAPAAAPTAQPAQPAPAVQRMPLAASVAPAPPSTPPSPAPAPKSAKDPATRSHVVKSGDTPATIARQHSVKLEALLAANPGLDPKRLKIGQTLNIPAP